MSRFLLQLIDTIKFNPYLKRTAKASIKTFFLGEKSHSDFFLTVESLYQDPGDRHIALYLAYQLFNTDTLIYLIEKLKNEKFLIGLDEILFQLLPIFFVPNFVGKYYCDIVVNILKSENEVKTYFESGNKFFSHSEDIPLFLLRMNQKANLTKCRQYLLFLSTVYFPVVRSCFYVRLLSEYKTPEDVNKKLLKFLSPKKIQAIYEGKYKMVEKLSNKNTNKLLTSLTQMYGWIQDVLSDNNQREHWLSAMDLDYLSQDDVLRFVMGKKMEMNLEENQFHFQLLDASKWDSSKPQRAARERWDICHNPRKRRKYIEQDMDED